MNMKRMERILKEKADHMEVHSESFLGMSRIHEIADHTKEISDLLLHNCEKRMAKRIAAYVTGIAVLFLSFILCLNVSPVFADTVSSVPWLHSIVSHLILHRGFEQTADTSYINECKLTATTDDLTLTMPYVIADEHNVIFFFQPPEGVLNKEDDYMKLSSITLSDSNTGKQIESVNSFSSVSKASLKENDNLFLLKSRIAGDKKQFPQALTLTVSFQKISLKDTSASLSENGTESDSVLNQIGPFTFHITLNDFVEPVVHTLNQTETMENQKFTIKSLKTYPTGTEIQVLFDEQNPCFISDLGFSILSEDGTLTEVAEDRITSEYEEDYSSAVFFIESDYFDQPSSQTLLLTSLSLIPKEKEYVTIDISTKTMTPAQEDITLLSVEEKDSSVTLAFLLNGPSVYNPFAQYFLDSDGLSHSLSNSGTTIEKGSETGTVITTFFTLTPPPDGRITLRRTDSLPIPITDPVSITLPAFNG